LIVAVGAMDQDEDVERLFSWLQTPEIRYREFAGAREVTDATVALQARTNTPQLNPPAPHHVQLDEEYPQDQFPDQSQVAVEVEPAARGPATIAPMPAEIRRESAMVPPAPTPAARAAEGEVFALGAAGRGVPPSPAPPLAPAAAAPPPPVPVLATAPPPPPPAIPSGLLGGAYRENGAEMPAELASDDRAERGRSLDSVFSRLNGGRARVPHPRDRMSRIPGLGPTTGRPR
jgi:hypothetical protein